VSTVLATVDLPLFELTSSSELNQSLAAFADPTAPAGSQGSSQGSSPLQRSQIWEPAFSRVCLTRLVPPAEFLTLSTSFFSQIPPALFHAGHTLGVFSSVPLADHRQLK